MGCDALGGRRGAGGEETAAADAPHSQDELKLSFLSSQHQAQTKFGQKSPNLDKLG